jgi:hypothetical protein
MTGDLADRPNASQPGQALYRLDGTKLSYHEYWQWRSGLPFLFSAFRKLFRIQDDIAVCCPRPEELLVIDKDAVPPRHQTAFAPLLAQLEILGFQFEFFYSIPLFGLVTGMGAVLTSADRLSLALVAHSEPTNPISPVPAAYGFNSFEGSGFILTTSGGLPGLMWPEPEVQLVRLRHRTLDQVYERHIERLSSVSTGLLPLQSEDVPTVLLLGMQRNFDYNVKRGAFVPLTEGEAVQLRILMRRTDW